MREFGAVVGAGRVRKLSSGARFTSVVAVVGLGVAASACVDFSIGKGGGQTSEASQEDQVATPDAGAPTGIDCIVEPTTGQTLCSGVAACPGLLVDHDVYPNCGFRQPGAGATSFQLECACSAALCPLGIASTCEQAARLLSQQSEQVVCIQLAEGRCTE